MTYQRKAIITTVMMPTRTVSTTFQKRENCRLRHNIGKASGPNATKSIVSTNETFSDQVGRRSRRSGAVGGDRLGKSASPASDSKIASAVDAPH